MSTQLRTKVDEICSGTPPGGLYAGFGARDIPGNVQATIRRIAAYLREKGLILRTNGSAGAAAAFEAGARDAKEVMLPWERYQGHPSPRFRPHTEAMYFAKHYHPEWDRLTTQAKMIMASNVQAILGEDTLSPVSFILNWGDPSADSSSDDLAHALRVVADFRLPILNLHEFAGISLQAAA